MNKYLVPARMKTAAAAFKSQAFHLRVLTRSLVLQKTERYPCIRKGSYSQDEHVSKHTHHSQAGAALIDKNLGVEEVNGIFHKTADETRRSMKKKGGGEKYIGAKHRRPGDLTLDRVSINNDSENDLLVAHTSARKKSDKSGDFKAKPELVDIVEKQTAIRKKQEDEAALSGKTVPSEDKRKITDSTHGEAGAHLGAQQLLGKKLREGKRPDERRLTQSINMKNKESLVPQESCFGCKPLNEEYHFDDNFEGVNTNKVGDYRKEVKEEVPKEERKAAEMNILNDISNTKGQLPKRMLERRADLALKQALLRQAIEDFVARSEEINVLQYGVIPRFAETSPYLVVAA